MNKSLFRGSGLLVTSSNVTQHCSLQIFEDNFLVNPIVDHITDQEETDEAIFTI